MRGFINIRNSIQAIELVIKKPPGKGDFRVIHQLTETHRVGEIAKEIQKLTKCKIEELPNPRIEMQNHEFDFEARKLQTLGLKTIPLLEDELPKILELARKYKDRIRKEVIMPKTKWR